MTDQDEQPETEQPEGTATVESVDPSTMGEMRSVHFGATKFSIRVIGICEMLKAAYGDRWLKVDYDATCNWMGDWITRWEGQYYCRPHETYNDREAIELAYLTKPRPKFILIEDLS